MVRVPAFEAALFAHAVVVDGFLAAPLASGLEVIEGFRVHWVTRMMAAAMMKKKNAPMTNLSMKSGLKISLLNTPL